MHKAVMLTTLAAGALVGAGYLGRRVQARAPLRTGIIPIVVPFIDITVAEDVLAVMERLPDDRVTLVLHTLGGCVTACVLIANALQKFKDSTAIIPYLAISGGTLIALSATRLEMGTAPRCPRSIPRSWASASSTWPRARTSRASRRSPASTTYPCASTSARGSARICRRTDWARRWIYS